MKACLKYSLNVDGVDNIKPNLKKSKFSIRENHNNNNHSNQKLYEISIPEYTRATIFEHKIREIPKHLIYSLPLGTAPCNIIGNIPEPIYKISEFQFDDYKYKYDYYTRPAIVDYDINHYKPKFYN
jgi:hypothetical protein